MNSSHLALIVVAVSASAFGQTPADWKTMKTAKGDCQMSVPAAWNLVEGLPNMASGPGKVGDSNVSFLPTKSLMQLNEAAQKALLVDKMIENSPQKVFYSVKPTSGASPITSYFVKIPRNGGVCFGHISVRAAVSEDTVRKIAASLH